MLRVTPELFALAVSGNPEDLKAALQNAIAIEHATMPPYLYAFYSLSGAANTEIKRVLRIIVEEEMLHMLLAGNLLKAIGGRPVIHSAEFVRAYPGPLPGIAGDFDVPLKRFSLELATDVFMRIEEPEKPLQFKVRTTAEAQPHTIGEFYRKIRKVLAEDPSLIQVTAGQPSNLQFEGDYPVKQTIESSADAVAAIDFIVGQGEGSDIDPYFRDGDNNPDNDSLAHYYRFAEIVRGRLKRNLTPPADPKPEDLYFYDAADKVPFDPGAVLPLRDNPRREHFPEGSEARQRLDQFSRAYTEVLRALDDAFNVDPARLDDAVGQMNGLRSAALRLVNFDFGDGTRLGPSFEFLLS